MKYRMRYAYYDLGEQEEGNTVAVRLHGTPANVILVDPQNFARYRAGEPFAYEGGISRRSPVQLPIPHDGHWYVVLDLGGRAGRVRGAVSVVDRDGSPVQIGAEAGLVEEPEATEAARQ